MKGIILAGGAGTRLYPASLPISKILLPVYDKPMIYYPLSTLMSAGIKDILIITTPQDINNFKNLLGNGSQWGVSLSYIPQLIKRGIADAFLLGKDFIGTDRVALILGDNIFYGSGFEQILQNEISQNKGATIFTYQVKDPTKFGVATFYKDGSVARLEEKPKNPESNFAVTGLYIYDNDVISYAKDLTPSVRGELEITDLNMAYLSCNNLRAVRLERGFAWFDTGTHESVLQAANFVHSMQLNQGIEIACLEEIALKKGYVSKDYVLDIVSSRPDNSYYEYVKDVLRRM